MTTIKIAISEADRNHVATALNHVAREVFDDANDAEAVRIRRLLQSVAKQFAEQ